MCIHIYTCIYIYIYIYIFMCTWQSMLHIFLLPRKLCYLVILLALLGTLSQRRHCVAVCCSMLQYVAVCCSVLQCVALWLTESAQAVIAHEAARPHLHAATHVLGTRDVWRGKEHSLLRWDAQGTHHCIARAIDKRLYKRLYNRLYQRLKHYCPRNIQEATQEALQDAETLTISWSSCCS